ncbi:hypothetical protein Tco_1179552, partial [Tanacetum coccineum]
MYVDGGLALEILYEHCFIRLRPEIKKQLIPATTPLIGFSGEIIWPIGQIQLLVKIGDEEHSASAWMNFMVVRSSSPYNEIIRRPGVRKLQAVPSTVHGMLKIPMELMIGSTLTEEGHNKLCGLLQHNLDIFFLEACEYYWLPKTHCGASPKRAGGMFSGIMKEVHYHDWLSNPVMVKKHDDSWRMCVDFKDLNKACPKDGYPLLEIDWK